jgi:hypothetical protein
MRLLGESDEEYTRCPECGKWDEQHQSGCLVGLRADYVAGRIELDEFEQRLGELIA